MNVSASKVMLILGLAAYTWCSWDHLSSHHVKPQADKKNARQLTAAVIDRGITFAPARDPFDSIPLDRTAIASGVLPNDPQKPLGELSLQGVFISFGRRVAVINGKTLQEGEIVESQPGGPMIRARQIGMDQVVVEGGGGVVVLRLSDPSKSDDAGDAPRTGNGAAIAAAPRGARSNTGGTGASPRNARRTPSDLASIHPEER